MFLRLVKNFPMSDETNVGAVISVLRRSFTKESSELPDTWTLDRPSTGQCHATALILHDIFGGRIIRGYVNGWCVHYWNVINGVTVDATLDQFPVVVYISEFQDATEEVLNETTKQKCTILFSNYVSNRYFAWY